MSDIADMADGQQEMTLQAQIDRIRGRQRQLHPCGACHWCLAPFGVNSPQLFCDTDCELDHRKHQRMKGA